MAEKTQIDDALIEEGFIDLLSREPRRIKIDDEELLIYPESLGTHLFLRRVLKQLGFNPASVARNAVAEVLRVVKENRDTVVRYIAYHTLGNKRIRDNEALQRSCDILAKGDDAGLVSLLLYVANQNDISRYVRHFHIDTDQRDRAKVARVKGEDSYSVTIGGRTILGSVILPACEKLRATVYEVLEEIPYVVTILALYDGITDIYLTKDEYRKAGVSKDRRVFSADGADIETIKSVMGGN